MGKQAEDPAAREAVAGHLFQDLARPLDRLVDLCRPPAKGKRIAGCVDALLPRVSCLRRVLKRSLAGFRSLGVVACGPVNVAEHPVGPGQSRMVRSFGEDVDGRGDLRDCLFAPAVDFAAPQLEQQAPETHVRLQESISCRPRSIECLGQYCLGRGKLPDVDQCLSELGQQRQPSRIECGEDRCRTLEQIRRRGDVSACASAMAC